MFWTAEVLRKNLWNRTPSDDQRVCVHSVLVWTMFSASFTRKCVFVLDRSPSGSRCFRKRTWQVFYVLSYQLTSHCAILSCTVSALQPSVLTRSKPSCTRTVTDLFFTTQPIPCDGEPVWPSGSKQKDLGSILFGSPFSSKIVVYGHCLVTLPTQLMKH